MVTEDEIHMLVERLEGAGEYPATLQGAPYPAIGMLRILLLLLTIMAAVPMAWIHAGFTLS